MAAAKLRERERVDSAKSLIVDRTQLVQVSGKQALQKKFPAKALTRLTRTKRT